MEMKYKIEKSKEIIPIINPAVARPLPFCEGLLLIWLRPMAERIIPRGEQQASAVTKPAIAIPFVFCGGSA